MNRLKLAIQGMNCNGCVKRVTDALRALPGVTVGQVAIGSAEITLDKTKSSPQAVTAALTQAGYPSRIAEMTKE